MQKYIRIMMIIVIVSLSLVMSGCAQMEWGFTFHKDGTITQEESVEVQQKVSQFGDATKELEAEKQKSIQKGYQVTDTDKGFTATKDYKNASEIAGLKMFQPNENKANGLFMRKGILYDTYSIEVFKHGEKQDLSVPQYQANIPSYFASDIDNIYDYLDYRRQAEEEARQINQITNEAAQMAINSVKMNLVINIPYGADYSNADKVSNDGKTLSWDLKPAFIDGKDLTLKAQFRIYHEKTIIALIVIGIILFIAAIVLSILGIYKWNTDKRSKTFLSIAIAILVVLIASSVYAKHTIDNPPTLTQADSLTLSSSSAQNDNTANSNDEETSEQVSSDNSNASNQDDTALNQANDILKNKNTQFKLGAVSKIDDDGFFGILDNGVAFVVYDKKDDIVAHVGYSKDLLDPKNNSNSKDKPLRFNMEIINDNPASKDKQAGSWSGTNHIIPVQVYTKEDNGKLVPLGIYTNDASQTDKFDKYLYDQQNVNIITTILNHADSLNSDIQARKISLH